MKSYLRLLGIFVFAWGVFGSCTHIDRAARRLATADEDYAKACKQMTKDELKAFRSFVKSDRSMAASMGYLGELAHLFRIDRNVYERDQVTMEAFLSKEKGILYSWLDTYAAIMLESCGVVRNNETPSICLAPEHTSKQAYEKYSRDHNASIRQTFEQEIAARGWSDTEVLESAHSAVSSGGCRDELDYTALLHAQKSAEFENFIKDSCKNLPRKELGSLIRKNGLISDPVSDLLAKHCGEANVYKFTRVFIKTGWSSEKIKNVFLGLDFYKCGCGPYIPKAYKKTQAYCGWADAKLKEEERSYPKATRDWIDLDSGRDPDIRSWVIANSGLWDKDKNEFVSADEALKICDDFKKKKSKGKWVKSFTNVEDAIDNLYRCLNSFELTQMELRNEVDSKTKRLKRDDQGQLIPREDKKYKSSTKNLGVCLEGYARNKVDADENGDPKEAPPPPPPPAQGAQDGHTDNKGPQSKGPQSKGPLPETNTGHYTPNPTPSPTTTPGSYTSQAKESDKKDGRYDPNATGSTDGQRREKPCLPGDSPGKSRCISDDACVRDFAYSADHGHWKIPKDLSTEDLQSMYKSERGDYIKALAKNQSELLAMGYVTQAFQRHWDSPAQYNQNLDLFIKESKDSDIKAHLTKLIGEEKMDPDVQDGAVDPMFSAQRFNYDTIGRQMVEAARRIHHMRAYIAILHRDLGASEIKTGAWFPKMSGEMYAVLSLVPHFWPVATYLYYIGGEDMWINFNNHTKYQCNMFSTMAADDWITPTDDLITMSDRQLRKMYNDQEKREAAFCEKDDQGRVTKCDVPWEFERYLEQTDPNSFKIDESRKKNNEFWTKELAAARARKAESEEIRKIEARIRYTAIPTKEVQAKLSAMWKQSMQIINRIALDNRGADAEKWLPKKIVELREELGAARQQGKKSKIEDLEEDIASYEAKLKIVTEFEALRGEVAPFQIKLRNWCGMRAEAAAGLKRASDTLATYYPVLARVDETKDDKKRKGRPFVETLADAIKKIEGNKRLTKEQVNAKYEALYKEAAAKVSQVLPETQEDLKRYLAKVSGLDNESAFTAILNGSMTAGFEYCDKDSPDKNGLPCWQRESYISCRMKAEANHWKEEQGVPEFLQQFVGNMLNAAPMLAAAGGGLKMMFTAKGILFGTATAVTFTGANYSLTKYIAKRNSARWLEYHNAVGALALEGVDSYANAVATIAAANPDFPTKDFIFSFVIGAAGSGLVSGKTAAKGKKGGGLPEGVLNEVAGKLTEHAQGKISRTQLTEFIAQKSGEHPELLDALPRALAEQLGTMSDGLYAKVFDGPDGTLAATRARKSMGTWMSGNAVRVFKFIQGLKEKLKVELLDQKRLSADEIAILKTEMEAVDFATLADNLGPREVALLAREVDNLVKSIKTDKAPKQMERVAEFLKKVCAAAAACTNLSGLRGCPK